MAPKKKKPKHTNLVLPTDGKGRKKEKRIKDRLGRAAGAPKPEVLPEKAPPELDIGEAKMDVLGGVEMRFTTAEEKQRQENARPRQPEDRPVGGFQTQSRSQRKRNQPPKQAASLPENAVEMPRVNPRVVAVRRRRRIKRFLGFLALLLVAVMAVAYVSGMHRYVELFAQNAYDMLRIRLTPGDGWPAPFHLTGYLSSDEMDGGGFAALGEKEMVIFSSSGEALRRVQHGYAAPGMSTGKTRVCIYSRGGTEYVIEGRSDTVLRRSTEQDILFAEMGQNGTLAVVTSSRYRANLEIYGPLYDQQPLLSWSLVDEKPVLGAFQADSHRFALACLSAQGGALGTTIHILQTNQDTPLAEIREDDARAVQMEYLPSGNLVVVYDTHTVLYSGKGEELGRYDYAGRGLMAADIGAGRCALVLGAPARDTGELVLLDDKLAVLFELEREMTKGPRVMNVQNGMFLLRGQQVEAFSLEGEETDSRIFQAKPLDLVQAGQPLVLTVVEAETLDDMLRPTRQAAQAADSTPALAESIVSAADPAGSDAPAESAAPEGEAVSAEAEPLQEQDTPEEGEPEGEEPPPPAEE